VLPSVVRFTAVVALVPLPVSEPPPVVTAVLVKLKLAGVVTPATLAVTV
jgi:hypothetical protein